VPSPSATWAAIAIAVAIAVERRPSVAADWRWEPVTDDLLDCLPPAALAADRQVAKELTGRP
jgi:hypothetical protein